MNPNPAGVAASYWGQRGCPGAEQLENSPGIQGCTWLSTLPPKGTVQLGRLASSSSMQTATAQQVLPGLWARGLLPADSTLPSLWPSAEAAADTDEVGGHCPSPTQD